MNISNYLSEVSNDDLADELEARGYMVYNDTCNLTRELSDDELIDEYSSRGLQAFDGVEDAIYFLEDKGFHVSKENELETMWHDIYSHALTTERDKFMQWLNGQFIMHIERWI